MQDIIYDLMKLGFSEKESAVYLSALQFGTAGAQEIGLRANVNRATTYSILHLLIDKGLITSLVECGEHRYRAESPHRILTLLHLQQKELEQRRMVADDLMLRLQVFHNVSSRKPIIRYYESFDGLRAMQREYEMLEQDIIQIVALDTLKKLRGKEATSADHVKSLEKRQAKIRAIVVSDISHDELSFPHVDCVIVPSSYIDIHGEMTVCGDRLVLFSYTSGIIAVEIQSKTIADTAKATLELAWMHAVDWKNKQEIGK